MPKRDTCSQFEQIVWLFLDGDMSERERILWEQHVSSCENCQNIRDEVRAVELAYHNLPDHDPPETALAEIYDRLKKPSHLERFFQTLRNRVPSQRLWQSSLIGAAVVIGSLLLVTLVRNRRSA